MATTEINNEDQQRRSTTKINNGDQQRRSTTEINNEDQQRRSTTKINNEDQQRRSTTKINKEDQQRNGTKEVISSRARINNNTPGKKQRHSASDENKTPKMMENGVWPKNTMVITGDGMLTNINERALSKNFNTKVRSFPGARVSDMFDTISSHSLERNQEKLSLL